MSKSISHCAANNAGGPVSKPRTCTAAEPSSNNNRRERKIFEKILYWIFLKKTRKVEKNQNFVKLLYSMGLRTGPGASLPVFKVLSFTSSVTLDKLLKHSGPQLPHL